jgi:hypothetical protein
MEKARVTKAKNYKAFIWAGVAVWAISALLFALNTGPFVARPLQFAAIVGVGLIIYGLVQTWRTRRS